MNINISVEVSLMTIMPGAPFINCRLILNHLFIEAIAAAVTANGIKLHIKIASGS